MIYYATVDGKEKEIKIEKKGGRYEVTIEGQTYEVDIRRLESQNALSLIVDNRCYEASVADSNRNVLVSISGEKFEIGLRDELEYRSGPSSAHPGQLETEEVKAPMPGVVVSVEVKEGQQVTAGSAMVIVEAMKMQNEISTVAGGTVKQILVKKGDIVDSRQTLVVLDRL